MSYAIASQFHGLSSHLQPMWEFIAYLSCIFVAGVAISGAVFFGGPAVYAAALQVARAGAARRARALEVTREAARGIAEIEAFLAGQQQAKQ